MELAEPEMKDMERKFPEFTRASLKRVLSAVPETAGLTIPTVCELMEAYYGEPCEHSTVLHENMERVRSLILSRLPSPVPEHRGMVPALAEYPHHVLCSGDRRFPAGVAGHSCSCLELRIPPDDYVPKSRLEGMYSIDQLREAGNKTGFYVAAEEIIAVLNPPSSPIIQSSATMEDEARIPFRPADPAFRAAPQSARRPQMASERLRPRIGKHVQRRPTVAERVGMTVSFESCGEIVVSEAAYGDLIDALKVIAKNGNKDSGDPEVYDGVWASITARAALRAAWVKE